MAGPDNPSDFRLEFIGSIVQKSLKLKPEKWSRLLMTEEYRNSVFDFLDNPLPAALFVALTPNAQLVASCRFPIPYQRTKGEIFFFITCCSIFFTIVDNYIFCKTSSLKEIN